MAIRNSTFPLIGLSPMDGLTDEPFRLIQTKIAKPDLIFTEFVSAEGLAHNAVKLYDHLLYSPQERPIIGQLFGKDPDSFYLAALILCSLGFDGIDINMGCPARTVTQHGSGAALIDKPQVAKDIILAVQAAIRDYQNQHSLATLGLKEKSLEIITKNNRYSRNVNHNLPTISVKTRIGVSEPAVDSWITFLCQFPLDFITLHGRTLKQGYAGNADWDEINKGAVIAHQAGIKFFGNGDIKNKKEGIIAAQKYGVDGILIGRAALGNPWAFLDPLPEISSRQKYDTMYLHAQIARALFPHRRFDYLRQQFLLYAAGLPNAKKLRESLIRVSSLDHLCALEADFVS